MWRLTVVVLGLVAALRSAAAQDRPDIIFVLVDDLDLGSMEALPGIRSLVAEPGATLSNAFVSLSLCCPARVTFLTGAYAHNTGVYGNRAPSGGYAGFRRFGDDRTIAVALRDGGYRTGLFGKFLNGYPLRDDPKRVPPGWDTWVAPTRGDFYGNYNYTLNIDGTLRTFGHQPSDYLTDVLSDRVVKFLEAGGDQPVFVWIAPTAPHGPATPAPRHDGAFAGAQAPRTPNFAEADRSDKRPAVSSRGPMDDRAIAATDALYRKRLASMLAVQDLIVRVIEVQTARGRMDDTYLVFASDNGFHLGAHGMARGKEQAWEEDLRIPVYVRGPGIAPGTDVPALVVNTDFAPTFAEWGGVAAPSCADGSSFAPWLRGEAPPWRDAFLIEKATQVAQEPEGDEPVAVERPGFVGVRTTRYKFIAHQDGSFELYDLVFDPYELQNVYAPDLPIVHALAARLRALERCAGDACRDAERAPAE
jgi:arylsulfatase A-like enzyme